MKRTLLFFDNLSAFMNELCKRGDSKNDPLRCWGCEAENEDTLAIVQMHAYLALPALKDIRLHLCHWCLPRFLNSYKILSAIVHNRRLRPDRDLMLVPMDASSCPCCKKEADSHDKHS